MSTSAETGSAPLVPAAGTEYPRTYRAFALMFPDADACTTYLEELRWPLGFVCPSPPVSG